MSTTDNTAVRRPGLTIRRRRTNVTGWLFVSPALTLFVIFVAGPFLLAILLALFDWDLLTPPKFVGLGNFTRLFADPVLPRTLANTLIFTAASIVTHIGIGLALAMAVNRIARRWLSYFVRVAVFFPFLISWAAVSLLWKYVLDPAFGPVPYALGQLGIEVPNLFADATWALPSIILVDLWHTLGFTFVILLAGLQTVPVELEEAAHIDGAGSWQTFWNVTLPMLSPVMFFATIITFIGAFQVFDPIQIITGGGPNGATRTIVMYLYEKGFRSFDMGYAAAVALLVFVIIMSVTILQFWGRKKWVHEG